MQARVPLNAEISDVVNLTQTYLLGFFETSFPAIDNVETNMTSSNFRLGEPFEINYTSAVDYPVGTSANEVAPALELEMLLMAAFSGTNVVVYLELLQGLPPENVFQTTTEVLFSIDPSEVALLPRSIGEDSERSSSSKGRIAGGVVAGAGACMAILVAVALRHKKHGGRRVKNKHDGTAKKDNDDAGHVTVAGDTYMADSTVFSGTSALRRQTRFAEATQFVDENQSLASRSDWGLSTRARSEVGSEESEEDRAERRLFDEEEPAFNRTLLEDIKETGEDVLAMRDDMRLPRHFDADELSDGDDLSVDDDVPMRVIDLIKKFTPSRSSFR